LVVLLSLGFVLLGFRACVGLCPWGFSMPGL